MPPSFPYYHDACLYTSSFWVSASDESPQEDRFMIDRWQRWQKSDEGRDGLDPWVLV